MVTYTVQDQIEMAQGAARVWNEVEFNRTNCSKEGYHADIYLAQVAHPNNFLSLIKKVQDAEASINEMITELSNTADLGSEDKNHAVNVNAANELAIAKLKMILATIRK